MIVQTTSPLAVGGAQAPHQPRPGRLKRLITGIPLAHRLLRFGKRVILMPRTVHRHLLAQGELLDLCRRQQQTIDSHARWATDTSVATSNETRREFHVRFDQLEATLEAKLTGRQDEPAEAVRQTMRTLMSQLGQAVTDEMAQLRTQHAQCFDLLTDRLREQSEVVTELVGCAKRLDEANPDEEVFAALTEKLDQISSSQREHGRRLESVAQIGTNHENWLGKLAEFDKGQADWLKAVADSMDGLNKWIGVVATKLEMMALDVRERVPVQPEQRDVPEPVIPDQDAFDRKVAEMDGDVRVNLGSGEKPWPDYLNIDRRELPGVDAVAEVLRLPFEEGDLGELASAHLVEHFRQHHLTQVILPYWKSLLKPDGGRLRIICPNWGAMLERFQDGRMDLESFHKVTFGGQDYCGDDHFAMYTPERMTGLLLEAGFSEVEVVTPERMNGLCPEMELVAKR